MRMPSRFPGIWALLLAMSVYAVAGSLDPRPSPVLQAIKDELARSMDTFKTQVVPPYFLSYEITETQSMSVYGAFGTLTYSGESRRRQLDIDLRVGDYKLDNTHSIRGGNSRSPVTRTLPSESGELEEMRVGPASLQEPLVHARASGPARMADLCASSPAAASYRYATKNNRRNGKSNLPSLCNG